MDNCIFCKIAEGEIPSNTIYEDEDFRVILDISPANIGHCLVIPKKHFKDITEIDSEILSKGIKIAQKTAKAQKKALNADGVNILQNNGESAGQTVNHFHIHVIPRFKGDDVVIEFNSKEHSNEEFAEIKEKIAKELQ
jgi:histidine triad (HIT) family protein